MRWSNRFAISLILSCLSEAVADTRRYEAITPGEPSRLQSVVKLPGRSVICHDFWP
jgi:hypothetical protein